MMQNRKRTLRHKKSTDEHKIDQSCSLTGEMWLSQIVQSISIATFVINKNHIVTHWNKACEKLTSITADKMIGTDQQWSAFYKKKRPVMADLIVDRKSEITFKSRYGEGCNRHSLVEDAFEVNGFLPHMGEKGKWLYFTAAPLRDIDGKIIGAVETLQDITESHLTAENLKETHTSLVIKQLALRNKNLALKEILNQIEDEKKLIKQRIQTNIDKTVTPILTSLIERVDIKDKESLQLVADNLADITSPFIKDIEDRFIKLTPRELEVCSMIRNGLDSKSIASILHVSPLTIDKQRSNIRNKLNIVNKGVNLKMFLINSQD
ncbi:MAG: PAS domain-containing protein [candidate division Zixibacteria bacterium]|nr:PAS domain-containing protein [candidate division Zixibacteria bacterium]